MSIPAFDDLVHMQRELEERLTSFAETDLRAVLDDLASGALYEAARRYVTRPSKRLFGMAFLVAYDALTGGSPQYDRSDLIAVAAALEVRHAAVLLHDDIVDGDMVRGGQPTAHHSLAEHFASEADHAALFTGDALTALLAKPILDSQLPAAQRVRLTALLLQLTADVAAGQIRQLELDTVTDVEAVDEAEILQVHGMMFAPYLNACLALAAALAGAEDNDTARMLSAMSPLGQGFQVQNDLAGFTELERVLASGATLTFANTSDLARRRRTVLVRMALDALVGDDRARVLGYLRGEDDDLECIASLIRASGAPGRCEALINDLFAQALRDLDADFAVPAALRAAFAATARYMLDLYDLSSQVSSLYLRARPDVSTS